MDEEMPFPLSFAEAVAKTRDEVVTEPAPGSVFVCSVGVMISPCVVAVEARGSGECDD